MKKPSGKIKNVTIDDLAVMVARGFNNTDKRFDSMGREIGELKKDMSEVKEGVKAARRDILDVGDRFVPRYEFDGLLIRFNRLEQKVKEKIK